MALGGNERQIALADDEPVALLHADVAHRGEPGLFALPHRYPHLPRIARDDLLADEPPVGLERDHLPAHAHHFRASVGMAGNRHRRGPPERDVAHRRLVARSEQRARRRVALERGIHHGQFLRRGLVELAIAVIDAIDVEQVAPGVLARRPARHAVVVGGHHRQRRAIGRGIGAENPHLATRHYRGIVGITDERGVLPARHRPFAFDQPRRQHGIDPRGIGPHADGIGVVGRERRGCDGFGAWIGQGDVQAIARSHRGGRHGLCRIGHDVPGRALAARAGHADRHRAAAGRVQLHGGKAPGGIGWRDLAGNAHELIRRGRLPLHRHRLRAVEQELTDSCAIDHAEVGPRHRLGREQVHRRQNRERLRRGLVEAAFPVVDAIDVAHGIARVRAGRPADQPVAIGLHHRVRRPGERRIRREYAQFRAIDERRIVAVTQEQRRIATPHGALRADQPDRQDRHGRDRHEAGRERGKACLRARQRRPVGQVGAYRQSGKPREIGLRRHGAGLRRGKGRRGDPQPGQRGNAGKQGGMARLERGLLGQDGLAVHWSYSCPEALVRALPAAIMSISITGGGPSQPLRNTSPIRSCRLARRASTSAAGSPAAAV